MLRNLNKPIVSLRLLAYQLAQRVLVLPLGPFRFGREVVVKGRSSGRRKVWVSMGGVDSPRGVYIVHI